MTYGLRIKISNYLLTKKQTIPKAKDRLRHKTQDELKIEVSIGNLRKYFYLKKLFSTQPQ